jgi:iron complex outermembrane receptor protein
VGARTVNEALMSLLGIPGRQDSYGGGNTALDLRGFGSTADSNQVVMLDGVRLSEADQASPRLDGIPIDQVERIEVLRGSGAVLYGEGATGGVIVITTRAGRARSGVGGSVYAAAGSHDTQELSADLGFGSGPWSFDVAAGRRLTDNDRANFHSATRNAALSGLWHVNAVTRVTARLQQDELRAGLPGALSTTDYAADSHKASTPDHWAFIRNQRAALSGQTVLAGWQVALDLGWRSKDLDSFLGSPYAYDVRADSQSLHAQRTLALAGWSHALQAGVDADDWKRNVAGSSATQRTLGVYVRDEASLPTDTRVALGARTVRLRKDLSTGTDRIDGRQPAWELGITQPLPQGWTIYGRLGRSFRLANADEFGFTAPGAALQPQTSRDAELGARWNLAPWKLELRAYRSRLKNEIGYDPAVGLYGANVNFDPTRRQGVEAELQTRLAPTLQAALHAAWRDARFVAGPYDGRRVPLTSRREAAVRLAWQPLPSQRAELAVRHVSAQHPDFDNQCSIPPHAVADLRYAVQFGDALELALKVANLADKRYYTQAYACAAGVPTSIYPEAGRSALASLRWTWR